MEQELGLSHRAYLTWVFAVPLVVAALLEAGVSIASDRWRRRRVAIAGQAGLAAALLFTAWTRAPWGLAAGLALAGAAGGVACSAAQGLLVASDPRGSDGAMARWALFGAIGDVIAPLVTGGVMAMGGSYRAAMAILAGAVAAQCVALWRSRADEEAPPETGDAPEPSARDSDAPPEPLLAALRRAARSPRLWAWLAAAAACTLLDELGVAVAVLRMQREQGLSDALAATAAVTFSAGSVFGAAWTDRAIARFRPRQLLLASGAACALAVALLLAAGGAPASCVALFALGAACAPHHPLAFARAYHEMPGHPGAVQAIAQLFVAVDVGAPLALGLVADRYGLRAAIGCLFLQPAVIVACAAALRPASRAPAPGDPPRP